MSAEFDSVISMLSLATIDIDLKNHRFERVGAVQQNDLFFFRECMTGIFKKINKLLFKTLVKLNTINVKTCVASGIMSWTPTNQKLQENLYGAWVLYSQ